MPRQDYRKDPGSTLDYGLDWSQYLDSDVTISSSSWSVEPSGELTVVEGSETHSAQKTEVKVQGGVEGTVYRLTCRIETSDGLTVERSLLILVEER